MGDGEIFGGLLSEVVATGAGICDNVPTRRWKCVATLVDSAVRKESLLTAADGKKYKTKFYNLDVIISVGYRVKSIRGTKFRQWATRKVNVCQHNHDRFLIIDDAVYIFGASLKDAGKKLFAYIRMQETSATELLNNIK